MLHYASQFANGLAKKYKVKSVVASYFKNDLWFYSDEIELFKIPTDPNPKSFLFDTLKFWNHFILIFKIWKFKPDIVHILDNHPWYFFYAKFAKIIWAELFVTQHDPFPHSWEDKGFINQIPIKLNIFLRKISDKLIVHWEWLKKELIKIWINEKKIISILHWEYNFFTKFSDGEVKIEENQFLFFWRFVEYKWIDTLLDSLDLVKKEVPNFKLLIAWSWDTEKFKDKFDKFKNEIEIVKWIEDEIVYKFFESSEFSIMPYKDATASWVIPVSYAFKKPIICTDVWSLVEYIENEKTWFLIPAREPKILAEKIIWMLKNKEKTIEMWKNWFEIFANWKLKWSEITDQIYK